MATVAEVVERLEVFAPPTLAEEWDNVGLLVGDRSRQAQKVMTCLTLSEDVADEAIAEGADLVVTHHPLPFRALRRLTTDTHEGRTLWKLIGAGTSIYSPHTAFDSAAEGINQQLADGLGLTDVQPLVPADLQPTDASLGAGRCGAVGESTTLQRLALQVGELLKIDHVRVVGDAQKSIDRVAVACGSGGSFLEAAVDSGADALVTGEATFHTLLAARADGVAVVLTGHYASERFAVEWLARFLAKEFADATVWASQAECDPLRLVNI